MAFMTNEQRKQVITALYDLESRDQHIAAKATAAIERISKALGAGFEDLINASPEDFIP